MKRLLTGRVFIWGGSASVALIAALAGVACSSSSASPNTGTSGSTSSGASGSGAGGSSSVNGGTSSSLGGSSTSFGGSTTTTSGGSPSANGGSTAGTTANGGATAGSTTVGSGGTTTTSSGGSGGGSAGVGGTAAKVKDCAVKKALVVPLMTNFDSYDGTVAVDAWSFPFNGTPADASVLYAGPYFVNDGTPTGAPTAQSGMVGGANGSMWAISTANPTAQGWGGAVSFWMGCADASAYKGLSFSLRGSTPVAKITVTVFMEDTSPPDATDPNGGGTCTGTTCKPPSAEVAITADWATIQVPWSAFTAGTGLAGTAVTPNGDRITGLSFGAEMVYAQDPTTLMYNPVPGAYDIEVDDLGFY